MNIIIIGKIVFNIHKRITTLDHKIYIYIHTHTHRHKLSIFGFNLPNKLELNKCCGYALCFLFFRVLLFFHKRVPFFSHVADRPTLKHGLEEHG